VALLARDGGHARQPGNLLVCSSGELKLADYGVLVGLKVPRRARAREGGRGLEGSCRGALSWRGRCRTPSSTTLHRRRWRQGSKFLSLECAYHLAPEVIRREDKGCFAADMWSFACCVLKMLTRRYFVPPSSLNIKFYQIAAGLAGRGP
jgi:serine/threonine protein kinase